MRGGGTVALPLFVRVLTKGANEWGYHVVNIKLDLAGESGSICHDASLRPLCARVGCVTAAQSGSASPDTCSVVRG